MRGAVPGPKGGRMGSTHRYDVVIKDGPVVFSDVSYKDATEYVVLDAGDYTLLVSNLAGSATSAVDRVIATYFQAPHSYTGEDVVELSAHGSPIVLRTIVREANQCVGIYARVLHAGRVDRGAAALLA